MNEEELEELLEDFFDYGEELDAEALNDLVEQAGIDGKKITFQQGQVIWLLIYNDQKYVIEKDESTELFEATKAEDWLDSAINEPDVYVQPENLEYFWERPVVLYHATDSDNVDSILKSGLRPESDTRATSNHWVGPAIFTSSNPYAIDAYGDTVLEIDTPAMARDGLMPEVSMEAGIYDYEARRALASYLFDEEEYLVELDASEGLDYDTVVIFGKIPAKYLRVYDD